MCMGGGGAGKAAAQQAEQAKAEEAARNARIAQGRSSIDNAFGQYNDDYYGNYKNSYTDFYNTDLDKQYTQAIDELTAALAGRGLLGSSYGNSQFAKLAETLGTNRTDVANRSIDAANSLKSKILQGKNDLYALNSSSADPESINSQALASAGSFAQPASFDALGNVFASALSPLIAYQAAKNNSINGPGANPGVYLNNGSSKSGGEVR